MTVHMRNPKSGGEYDAHPLQVEHLKLSGWQVAPGQQEQGEEWPTEARLFEGQPVVHMRKSDVANEITVAESAVPFHQERGWQRIEAEPAGEPESLAEAVRPEAAEEGDGLEGRTVPELRELAKAQGISPIPTTKPELLDALRSTPAETPAEPTEEAEA